MTLQNSSTGDFVKGLPTSRDGEVTKVGPVSMVVKDGPHDVFGERTGSTNMREGETHKRYLVDLNRKNYVQLV